MAESAAAAELVDLLAETPPWRRDSNKMASGNPGAVQERKTRRVMSAGVMQIGCVLKRGHPSRPT
jgi:hypothetical protein